MIFHKLRQRPFFIKYYHSHPRPSHEDMGGKTYAIGKARTIDGVHYPSFEAEAKPLLEEYGCLHFKFSVLLGVSRPAHTKEQLAKLKADDKKTFEFEGKEYTKYEASQIQSRLESAIKRQKDRQIIAKAAGCEELRQQAQYKLNLLTSKYAKLSETCELPTKMEKMQVAGYRKVKAIDNALENDIIKIDVDEVFEKAKNGKRHSGTYVDAMKKKENQLNSSILSHEKQVEEHFDKIRNPWKYDKRWKNKSLQEQNGELKKWKKDAIRNYEEAEIEKRVRYERFGT